MQKTIQLFKALSDKSRLRIINSLREGPMYVELLSQRLELAPSTVSFHLKKLEECGLVSSEKDQYYVVFSLNNDILDNKIIDLVNVKDEETYKQKEREEHYKKSVIETYFIDDKLKLIPVQNEKRRIVLEKIITIFDDSNKYKEKEVNIMLADINDDFVTLRRELIKSNLLTEEKGYYRVNKEGTFIKNSKNIKVSNVVEDILINGEKVIFIKQDGFVLDMKGVMRNRVKDETIYITNKGRILTYQTTSINGFEFSKYVFSYNFVEVDKTKESKSFLENCFGSFKFQETKKITYNILEDEVICYGKDLKLRQETIPFGIEATMNLTFNLTLDEFEEINNKIDVKLFEEEKK